MTSNRTAGMVLGALLFLMAVLAHKWLEAGMLSHMLLQLPSIAAAGWLMFGKARWLERVAPFDAHGLTVFSGGLFLSAYWMIPRALEISITSGLSETVKFGTLFVIGAMLPGAIARANSIIQMFFLGNFCAMTAIVGMLYQDQARQLCNAYLIDDQSITGMGLVLASGALAIWWCVHNFSLLADISPDTELR